MLRTEIDGEQPEVKIESSKSTKASPHKDKPEFKEFCILFCESELIKIENLHRSLKKAKKEYVKLQNRFKQTNGNDEAHEVCKEFPDIELTYDRLDADLERVEKELAEFREMQEKAIAMELETQKLEKEGKIRPEILHGSDKPIKGDLNE